MLIFISLFSVITLASADFGKYESVDLSHTQDAGSLGWVTFKPFERKVAIKQFTAEWGQPEQW